MAFKRCSIDTKCAKKISPTPLHHQQPEPLRQGRMIHAFMFFTPNSDPNIWMSQQKSRLIRPDKHFFNLLLSSFGESVWIVSSVCCSYLTGAAPVWSSAAGVHLLQGSTCCVFRDGILQILVVTSGYLSYCCLSIISNQSVHSPLTSDINKAFSSTQLLLTGYFLFSDRSL